MNDKGDSSQGAGWPTDLDTGCATIDGQHRTLVTLCRKLELAAHAHVEPAILVGHCIELKKYTEFHFASEENIMRSVGYPGREAHARAHARLLVEIELWGGRVNLGRESPAVLLQSLRAWLVGHIQGDDARLADYIRSQDPGSPMMARYRIYQQAEAGGAG